MADAIDADMDADLKESDEENEGAKESGNGGNSGYTPSNYIQRLNEGEEEHGAALWLITFTDAIALMLTFFVLLYSMSVPEDDKWKELSLSITSEFTQSHSKPFKEGPNQEISIEKITLQKALDLDYLETLLTDTFAEQDITELRILRRTDSLVISLPSDLLFDAGSATIKEESRRPIFVIGGTLSRISNRVEVIGHTDPQRPSANNSGGFANNWELSLARSTALAAMMRSVGYDRRLVVRGLSSALFDQLPQELALQKRYELARRVDIAIYEDTGGTKEYMQLR